MLKNWLKQAALAGCLALSPLPALAAEGTITVTYKDDIATLDPAIGYDWQNWSMIKSLFSRLMDYTPGTADLIPSLAESFTVAPDGLTYTFKLRKGVKFSNGREVVASDVKYSIERAVNPKNQGPGAGFFGAIAGHEEMTAGKADTLPGVETPDDRPSSSSCRGPTPPSCMCLPSTSPPSSRRRWWRPKAPISARSPWAPAPSR